VEGSVEESVEESVATISRWCGGSTLPYTLHILCVLCMYCTVYLVLLPLPDTIIITWYYYYEAPTSLFVELDGSSVYFVRTSSSTSGPGYLCACTPNDTAPRQVTVTSTVSL